MLYRGFPSKLHHELPHWVEPGALFHIRIGLHRGKDRTHLTAPILAQQLLESARFYEAKQRWHITLFLLMPDHIHALLSFPKDEAMSCVIGDWKHFQTRKLGIVWQEGYFDHRLRDDERGEQLSAKMNYIRQNPVAAGLCTRAEDWLWLLNALREVDRPLRGRCYKLAAALPLLASSKGLLDPPLTHARAARSVAR